MTSALQPWRAALADWPSLHIESLAQPCHQRRTIADLTAPNGQCSPAQSCELLRSRSIATSISRQFFTPEVGSGGRQFRTWTSGMTMPEAAVHEDCKPMSGQHDVRCAGQAAVVKSETKTCVMKSRPDSQFRSSVASPHSRHFGAFSR